MSALRTDASRKFRFIRVRKCILKMKYDLMRMDPATFESIAQSLFQNMLGPTCKIYGAGPDGQREAVCDIAYPAEILGRQISGRTFLQAKYKDQETKETDLT